MGPAHVPMFCAGCGGRWTYRVTPGVDPIPRHCPECEGELVWEGDSTNIAGHFRYARYRALRERVSVRLAYRSAAVAATVYGDRGGYSPSKRVFEIREEVLRKYPEMLERWDRANARFVQKIRAKEANR
jgi:hypothetical protein